MSSQLILHVAMQIGLYLHRSTIGVWRVVSEDSDNFGSWFLVIHGFGDFDDLDQPAGCQMSADPDQIHALCELQEVALLGSPQRIRFEKRNDGLYQTLRELEHSICTSALCGCRIYC